MTFWAVFQHRPLLDLFGCKDSHKSWKIKKKRGKEEEREREQGVRKRPARRMGSMPPVRWSQSSNQSPTKQSTLSGLLLNDLSEKRGEISPFSRSIYPQSYIKGKLPRFCNLNLLAVLYIFFCTFCNCLELSN